MELVKGKWYLIKDNHYIKYSHTDYSHDKKYCSEFITNNKQYYNVGGNFGGSIVEEVSISIIKDYLPKEHPDLQNNVENLSLIYY